jgi:hypothetical protein
MTESIEDPHHQHIISDDYRPLSCIRFLPLPCHTTSRAWRRHNHTEHDNDDYCRSTNSHERPHCDHPHKDPFIGTNTFIQLGTPISIYTRVASAKKSE